MINKYDCICIFYLGTEILRMLILKSVYIDLYYKTIVDIILQDFKKYDNKNKSLLDNIQNYISENKESILQILMREGVLA